MKNRFVQRDAFWREWWLRTWVLKRKHTRQQQSSAYVHISIQTRRPKITSHRKYPHRQIGLNWENTKVWAIITIFTFHLIHAYSHLSFILLHAEELYKTDAFTHLQNCNRTVTMFLFSVQSYSEAAVGWVIRWALGLRVNRAHLQQDVT